MVLNCYKESLALKRKEEEARETVGVRQAFYDLWA